MRCNEKVRDEMLPRAASVSISAKNPAGFVRRRRGNGIVANFQSFKRIQKAFCGRETAGKLGKDDRANNQLTFLGCLIEAPLPTFETRFLV